MHDSDLTHAIRLREAGGNEEAEAILLALVTEDPDNPEVNYQLAWVLDKLGRERDAVPYYERAIKLGLPDIDLQRAFLGLGSTYRCLADYQKAISTFQRGIARFPGNRALQVFLAMTFYNMKKHGEAMQLLLLNIAETTTDGELLHYKDAILYYLPRLDDTMK